MNDTDRIMLNTKQLEGLHPNFRVRVLTILAGLVAAEYRPRIACGWRSIEAQLKAYTAGTSHVKYGMHNVTGSDGTPESLAVDVLDDDAPLAPSRKYLMTLAWEAERAGCITGIRWGLPAELQQTIDEALRHRDLDVAYKPGWDPTHVQADGLTIQQARYAGMRPGPWNGGQIGAV